MAEFDPQKISTSLYNIEKILAKMLKKDNCCGGSAGSGVGEAEPEPYVDDGGTPPPDYDDYNQYRQWKCGMIEAYLQTWKEDLIRLEVLDLVGVGVSALAGAGGILLTVLLTPVPFDDIIIMALAISAIVVILAGMTDVVSQAVTYIDNLDPCDLINTPNVSAATQYLISDINAQAFAIQDQNTKAILKSFVNNDALNVLFGPKPPLSDASSLACDSCGSGCPEISFPFGTVLNQGSGFVELEPVVTTGYVLAMISFGTGCYQEITDISILSGDIIPGPDSPGGNTASVYMQGQGEVSYLNWADAIGDCTQYLQIYSDLSFFTIRIEWGDCP